MAEHEELINRGKVYLAPPDRNLLVKDGHILLGQGPPENRWRPSIDMLFRSAAVAYKSHGIGIILSGLMQDGTDGMMAIRECGGTCVVQDPRKPSTPICRTLFKCAYTGLLHFSNCYEQPAPGKDH